MSHRDVSRDPFGTLRGAGATIMIERLLFDSSIRIVRLRHDVRRSDGELNRLGKISASVLCPH